VFDVTIIEPRAFTLTWIFNYVCAHTEMLFAKLVRRGCPD